MEQKRASLGWKALAVLLFLLSVAAAFACIFGLINMYSSGYGKGRSYFDSSLCQEQVSEYQELVAAAMRCQRALEGEDLTYLERQQLEQSLERLTEQLSPDQTNFRFQVKNFDGSQVLLSNLREGETLEQAVSFRWYASILADGSQVLLADADGISYPLDFFRFYYGSSENLTVSADRELSLELQPYTEVLRQVYEEIMGTPIPDDLYAALEEQWSAAQADAAEESAAEKEMMVLECGLPEDLGAAADCFQSDCAEFFNHQRLLPWIFFIGAFSILTALICLIFLCLGAGHKKGVAGIHLNWQDRIWYDVYLAGAVMLGLCLVASTDLYLWHGQSLPVKLAEIVAFAVVPASALLLAVLLTTVTRCKAGTLWRGTLVAKCCHGVKWFFQTIPITWRLVLCFFCYLLLIILMIEALRWQFILPMMFLDTCILLYMCWWAVNFSRLRRAGTALASGDLDYRVDTHHMPSDLRRHGKDLNNISGGMANAVQQQMKSERFKAELITNVSHDLKTPLTSIINYVDLLKKTDIQDEKALEYIRVLDNKSQRLKKLTEDLVEASKASTGTLAVNREKLGMVQLINQALGEYEEKLEAHHLQVVTSLPESEVYVNADGRHLWRVLDNLLSNCVKYAMEGTRIYLELSRGHGQIILSLKNISRDALNVPPEQLMERFVRGDQSRTTEGSGLGLSIARSLTELQGGIFEISVDGDLFKAAVSLPQMV